MRNAPRAGRRIDLCDGLQSLHEVRRKIRRSLPGFQHDERHFSAGLPREVPVEVEEAVEEIVDAKVWASAIIDGQPLFLVRDSSVPNTIVNQEGDIVHELPRHSISTRTVWKPEENTVVFFNTGSFADDPPYPSLADYSIAGLRLEVVVANYRTGRTEVYELSQYGTAEFLLALEAGEQ